MIHDRGQKKWVSMMLPEHVKLLREYNESMNEVKKPILDEQKYEEFNDIISKAMEENIALEFTYYQKGEIKKLVGNIHYIDSLNKEIQVSSQELNNHILRLENIIEIMKY